MTYDDDAITDMLEEVDREGHPKIQVDLAKALSAVASLPPAWEPLRATADRKQALAALWQPVADKLPRTVQMLQRKLAGFAILTTDAVPMSLLYLLDEGRDLMAFRGFPPVATLPEAARALSVDLSPLYRLHDGWVNLFSGEDGPAPSGQWKVRGQAKGVKGFLEVFSKGSQALGFDLDDAPAKAFSMDTDDDEVEAVADFWAELDERLAMDLKAFPDAKP
jgi:hypothetical protein